MKKIILFIGILYGLLFSSCTNEIVDVPGTTPIIKGELTLKYTILSQGSEAVTRAGVMPEEGEENVNDIVLLFFEKTDDQTGLFVDHIVITPPEGESLKMNDPIQISYQGKSLIAGTAYRILAVANMSGINYLESGTLDDWGASWAGQKEGQVIERALAYAKGSENSDNNAILSSGILMSGSTSISSTQTTINIDFIRGVARFDVATTLSIKEGYDLISVSIWNAYPQASVFDGSYLEYGNDVWRIKRFYGVNNAENYVTDEDNNIVNGMDGSPLIGDVKSGLYTFVNRVGGPQQNDTQTTCLIIGLHDRSASDSKQISYYRVNIHPDQSGQSLKRNNVYKLTIRGVLGSGKGTEGEAYSGTSTELEYTINYWDLDDNGLVVQDQNSVLSIPVKTIRFGNNGGINEYSIYTFTTLQTNPVLTLSSQDYNVSGRINARLEGNTLIVTADALDSGEEDRSGMITLRFAGLTATMSVVQSSSIDRYLTVTKPEEGTLIFPSMAGISSGDFSVTASGPWTATLYLDGFSFDLNDSGKTVLTQSEAISNKFKIWTVSPNTDTKSRQGVLVVSLDEDPDNYSAAIVFSQKAPGGITVQPELDEIIFSGAGTPVTADLLNIYPSYEDNGSSADPRYSIHSWEYVLFDYNTETPYTGDRFYVVIPNRTTETNTFPGTKDLNTLKVVVNGANNSSIQSRATLRVKLTSDPSKYTDITLLQRPQSLQLDPGSISSEIPAVGGQTQLITVKGDESMKWRATLTQSSGTSSDSRRLVNHSPSFVDQDGTIIDITQPQRMATQFRVVMPKIYWPNREIPNIQVVLQVELLDADNTPTGVKATALTVKQTSLVSNGFTAWNVRTGWGALAGSSYFGRYLEAINARSDYSYSSSYVTSGSKATTYVHLAVESLPAGYDWSTIESFRTGKDGVSLILADVTSSNGQSSLKSSTSPLTKSGYTIQAGGTGGGVGIAVVNDDVSSSRIYQFLMQYGGYIKAPQKATSGSYAGYVNFQTDGTRSEATAIPATAVPIIKHKTTGTTLMAIDPANKLVFMGECQMFETPAYVASQNTYGHGYGFMCNFIHYLENASKYGSHFTDMLRESLEESSGGTPNPIPAPWADAWGTNKWVAGPASTSK